MFKDKPVVFLLLVSPPVFPNEVLPNEVELLPKLVLPIVLPVFRPVPIPPSEEEFVVSETRVVVCTETCAIVVCTEIRITETRVGVSSEACVSRVGVSETRVVTTTKSDAGIRSER